MRIMGLDVGEKTIGVAISDALGLTAQGVDVIRRTRLADDLERVQHFVREHDVNEIVIGLPRNMDGTLGPRAKQCQTFANDVRKHIDIPVTMWDERLTTMAAERTLITADMSRAKRKRVIDKLAASIMLQSYLDGRRRNSDG